MKIKLFFRYLLCSLATFTFLLFFNPSSVSAATSENIQGNPSYQYEPAYRHDLTENETVKQSLIDGYYVGFVWNEFVEYDVAVLFPNWADVMVVDYNKHSELYVDLNGHHLYDLYLKYIWIDAFGATYTSHEWKIGAYYNNTNQDFWSPVSDNDAGSGLWKIPYDNTVTMDYDYLASLGHLSWYMVSNHYEQNFVDYCCPVVTSVSSFDTLQDFEKFYSSFKNVAQYNPKLNRELPKPSSISFSPTGSILHDNDSSDLKEVCTNNSVPSAQLMISCSATFDALSIQKIQKVIDSGAEEPLREVSTFEFLYDLAYELWKIPGITLDSFEDAKSSLYHSHGGGGHFGGSGNFGVDKETQDLYSALTYESISVDKSDIFSPMVNISNVDIPLSDNRYSIDLTYTIEKLKRVCSIYSVCNGYSPYVQLKNYVFRLAYVVQIDGVLQRSDYVYYVYNENGLSLLCDENQAKTYGFLPSNYDEENDLVYDQNGFDDTNDNLSNIKNYIYLNILSNPSTGGGQGGEGGSASAIGIDGDVNLNQENNQSIGDINVNVDSHGGGGIWDKVQIDVDGSSNMWTSLKDGFTSGFGLIGEDGIVATLSTCINLFDPNGLIFGLLALGIGLVIVLGFIKFFVK